MRICVDAIESSTDNPPLSRFGVPDGENDRKEKVKATMVKIWIWRRRWRSPQYPDGLLIPRGG